jgi:hypothetical protein
MKAVRRTGLFLSTIALVSTFTIQDAFGQSRSRSGGAASALPTGASSLGIAFSTVSASQDDLNGVAGLNSGKDMSSAIEVAATWIYRYDRTSYAFVLRPSYFMQSTDSGTTEIKLTGFTLFPMFRMYPLENTFIKFFLQGGLGYGSLKGAMDIASTTVDFEGSAFGAVGGLGVDFCFTDAHCLTIEGNIRYLPIERNKVTGGNCSTMTGTTQCTTGNELEVNNKDLQTTMSGIQGLIGYTMNF